MTTFVRACLAVGICTAMATLSLGCDSSGSGSVGTVEKKAEDPSVTARNIYVARCSVCHGNTGKGDGPGAAALDPKPRDLGDPEWQASVTDEHIATIIAQGGAAVGKSPGMPPAPDLAKDPAKLDALVRYVRSMGK